MDAYIPTARCVGCGQECDASNGTAFWVDTALGIAVLRSHRGPCEALAVARYQEQPVKRITLGPTREEQRDQAKRRSSSRAK